MLCRYRRPGFVVRFPRCGPRHYGRLMSGRCRNHCGIQSPNRGTVLRSAARWIDRDRWIQRRSSPHPRRINGDWRIPRESHPNARRINRDWWMPRVHPSSLLLAARGETINPRDHQGRESGAIGKFETGGRGDGVRSSGLLRRRQNCRRYAGMHQTHCGPHCNVTAHDVLPARCYRFRCW